MSKNTLWEYYQPNKKDLKDHCGDCSIRALTKAFDMTWLEAFDALVEYARHTQMLINEHPNIELFMKERQIPYVSIYKPKAKKKMTVNDFARNHKNGTYVLYIRVGYGSHLVAVTDGKFYDTWDCGDRIVYGHWIIKEEN